VPGEGLGAGTGFGQDQAVGPQPVEQGGELRRIEDVEPAGDDGDGAAFTGLFLHL
jgi:hypothetical protein